MTRAFVIPVEGEMHWADTDGLDSLQSLVGGYIEAIEVPVSNADEITYLTGWLNEEGKIKKLALNQRGTDLTAGTLFPEDYIAGPLVLMGPPDDDGNDTDAPEWLLDGVRNFLR